MYHSTKRLLATGLALLVIAAPAAAESADVQQRGAAGGAISVPGDVALASLMTLSDGYLQKFADSFSVFALTHEARSANWSVIRTPLAAIAARNIDALVWFALPDGSYWSVQEGHASGNLSDRPYFPHVLAGETVVGPLVVSKATRKCSAIVAVPITNDRGVVIGVLGASVYLDQLSARLNNEMAMSADMIFYSFDATPLLALEWDPQLIFVDPFSLGQDIREVFEYMLSLDEGTVRYRWTAEWRTVIFRRSTVTGWWYVVGIAGR